ncbi:hypothetical protein ACWER6_01510 [Streptomyces sp. NPDC004009]
MGGALSAAQYPADIYNYGLKEATKRLSESLTDPLGVVPDGQGAGCAFFGTVCCCSRRRSTDMRGIPSGELVERLVRLLPEVVPHVDEAARRRGLRASQVNHWDQVNTHPGTFLSEVLVYPLFKPQMMSAEPTPEQEDFLARCFEFIEGLEESPAGELVDTAHFTFLENLLESKAVLDRAFRFALPRTRAEILFMLRGWNIPVDPAWEDPARERRDT